MRAVGRNTTGGQVQRGAREGPSALALSTFSAHHSRILTAASGGGMRRRCAMYPRLRPLGHFVRHLLEMCLVMCLGMAVLDGVFYAIARLVGYPDPLVQLPELSTLVVAFNMTAPMVAWMRFRGHDWRPVWEMF